MYTRARSNSRASRHPRHEHRQGMNRHARHEADRLFHRIHRRASGRFTTVSKAPNLIVGRSANGLMIRRKLDTSDEAPAKAALIEWQHVLAAIDLLIFDGKVGRRELMEETQVRDTSCVLGLILSFGEGIRLLVTVKRRVYLRRITVAIYFSGMEKNPTEMQLVDKVGGYCVMVSFATIDNRVKGRDGGPPTWLTNIQKHGFSWLLDSGAFGFMTRAEKARKAGEPLTVDWWAILDKFCALITRYSIRRYFQLDVIGNWQLSKALLIAMLKRGLRPIPVFHMGDPWEYLDWMVNELGAVEIGLGGAAKASEEERSNWLGEATHRHPPNRVLFHGFGMASRDTVARHPLNSADASTPFQAGKNGEVMSDVGRFKSDLPRLARIEHNFGWMLSLGRRSGRPEFQLDLPVNLRLDVATLAS